MGILDVWSEVSVLKEWKFHENICWKKLLYCLQQCRASYTTAMVHTRLDTKFVAVNTGSMLMVGLCVMACGRNRHWRRQELKYCWSRWWCMLILEKPVIINIQSVYKSVLHTSIGIEVLVDMVKRDEMLISTSCHEIKTRLEILLSMEKQITLDHCLCTSCVQWYWTQREDACMSTKYLSWGGWSFWGLRDPGSFLHLDPMWWVVCQMTQLEWLVQQG